MADQNDDKRNINSSRRDFLRQSGLLAVGAAVSRFSFASDNDQDKPKLPEVHVKSSSAWIAGEEEFLDDSKIDASDPAKVNVDLDTPFYLASPTKLLVDLVLLSALDGRYKDIQISPDEELVMSPYALMRSTNSAFANLTKDNFILLDGKKTDTIPVHKSREWLTAFSLNDVTQALVERIANGRQIESGLSIGKSVRLEQKFIAEYINPLLEELGMRPGKIVSLLENIGAFESTENFERFLITVQADKQGRLGMEDKPYPQAEYLRQAHSAVRNSMALERDPERIKIRCNEAVSKLKKLSANGKAVE